MKKQEEIFHEIQDMMGETKEGRIRWSVEVQTTEANPVEEKPVEHEDGLDWTIDECYVSYFKFLKNLLQIQRKRFLSDHL